MVIEGGAEGEGEWTVGRHMRKGSSLEWWSAFASW